MALQDRSRICNFLRPVIYIGSHPAAKLFAALIAVAVLFVPKPAAYAALKCDGTPMSTTYREIVGARGNTGA